MHYVNNGGASTRRSSGPLQRAFQRPVVGQAAIFVLFALSLFTFLAAAMITASPYPDDQDGVNFLLGIDRYDLAFHRPHFPGYPVYIAAGKIFSRLAGSAEWGLILLSAISAAGSGLLMFLVARRRAGDAAALALAVAFLANPMIFEFSHKMYSESMGLLMLLGAFAVLGGGRISGRVLKYSSEQPATWVTTTPPLTGGGGEMVKNFISLFWTPHRNPRPQEGERELLPYPIRPIRFFLAGALIGLTMGVRLSWWPYAIGFLAFALSAGAFRVAISGAAIGAALWFIPQVEYVGMARMMDIGVAFTAGHFETWGGALGAASAVDSRLASFTARLSETLWFAGGEPLLLRLPWTLLSVSGVAVWVFGKTSLSRTERVFIMASALYLLWALLGQNLDKTRHFLPAIPALLFLLIPFAKKNPGIVLAGALALSLTIPFNHWNRAHRDPPAARLHDWVQERTEKDTVLYCGQAERFFDRYPVDIAVKSVESADALDMVSMAQLTEPKRRLICGDIPGLTLNAAPVAVFERRPGDPVDKTLRIYDMADRNP